jgi:ATP-dependent Lon protease
MPETKMQVLPLLPLKSSTLFPGLLKPLSVGRAASRAAVESRARDRKKKN